MFFQVIKLKTLPLGVKCLVVACINFILKSSLDNFICAHIIAAKYGPEADVKTCGRDAKANKVFNHKPIERKPFFFLTYDMYYMFINTILLSKFVPKNILSYIIFILNKFIVSLNIPKIS